MATKERIKRIVDDLDEAQADALFVLLDRFAPAPDRAAPTLDTTGFAAAKPDPAGHVLTPDSPLWDIVGLVDDDGPTDVSENVDAYLALAYADNHDEAG